MGAGDFTEVSLLDNELVSVRRDGGSRVVRVTRTDAPLTTLAQVEECWGGVNRALCRLEREELCLLMDMRGARGRNDDAFERAVAKHRAATVSGFRRVAVLVQSLHGQLQVQRHVREDKLGEVRVFDREEPALDWLEGAV